MINALRQARGATIVLSLAGALAVMPAGAGWAHGGPGGMSGVHGNFGGQSSSHMSARGAARTNGPHAVDRDFGIIHARSRMSAKGLTHSKSFLHAHRTIDADSDADDLPTP